MSWGRYNYYGQPNKEKFYFSEQEIDFTIEDLDYEQFLLQEFFGADLETRKKISDYYLKKYGNRAFEYFQKKYSLWANGNYHLTDLMKGRIISLMPKFLNDDAKYKLGINDFITTIKRTVDSFWYKSNNPKYSFFSNSRLTDFNDVVALFENDYQMINAMTIDYFQYNVLNNEEMKEALEISKFILKVKLQNAFNQVKKDFETFLPFVRKFKSGTLFAKYYISYYEESLSLRDLDFHGVTLPSFEIKEIVSRTQYSKYCNKYLAYEMLSLNSESKIAISKSFLNEDDLSLFYSQYEELSQGESFFKMNGTFQGEGGVLELSVKMKTIKALKMSITKSVMKLIIYLLIITLVVAWSIKQEWFLFLVFVVLGLGFHIVFFISEAYNECKILINEYRKYGK